MDYFQDDIYPETRVKWEAAVMAEEWFAGKNSTQNFISLRPEGMKLCKHMYAQQGMTVVTVWCILNFNVCSEVTFVIYYL